MQTACLHEFHFVMDRKMKKSLQSLKIYKETGSLSCVIVRILSLLSPVIKREHKWGKQRGSRYMTVCDDPNEIREHVHVYLSQRMYRQLKLIHQDLNFYSIAQLLREFLKFFVRLMKVYGKKIYQELKNTFNQWKDMENKSRLTLREFIRQLWRILQHLRRKSRLITIYNNDYSPFWIFRQ